MKTPLDGLPFVADSSVWIDLFGRRETRAASYLEQRILEDAPVLVPGVVAFELLRGAPNPREVQRLARQFAKLDPAPNLTPSDYAQAAALSRLCRDRGWIVQSAVDCLLAQLCIRTGLPLLTSDRTFIALSQVAPLKLIEPPMH